MNEATTSSTAHVAFRYDSEPVVIWSVSDNDHILSVMRRMNTFYERDVLERIRERLSKRGALAAAVDVGAFVGTHSIYFSKYCKLHPVLAFEPNKKTFSILKKNILINKLQEGVMLSNKALGSSLGHASVVLGEETNQGTASVVYDSKYGADFVEVTTLDYVIGRMDENFFGVSLIKIDVEGAELEVLQGARDTIKNYEPILCVEVHRPKNLLKILSYLGKSRYWIVDCLGSSPTYILEPADTLYAQRLFVNFLWFTRSVIPEGYLIIRWYLRRLAQVLSTGKWDTR